MDSSQKISPLTKQDCQRYFISDVHRASFSQMTSNSDRSIGSFLDEKQHHWSCLVTFNRSVSMELFHSNGMTHFICSNVSRSCSSDELEQSQEESSTLWNLTYHLCPRLINSRWFLDMQFVSPNHKTPCLVVCRDTQLFFFGSVRTESRRQSVLAYGNDEWFLLGWNFYKDVSRREREREREHSHQSRHLLEQKRRKNE